MAASALELESKRIPLGSIRELEALSDEVLLQRITQKKLEMGEDLKILAHFYQRKAIGDLADFQGDSYGLSKQASQAQGGKYILFCGVRFMAESAAILAREDQKVIHPDPHAGCPMADMASLKEVSRAWDELSTLGKKIIPVTYMNSTADIKAFCGQHEGTICTSSNAQKTLEWAYQQGSQVFFLPDEHLGRNTALKLGIHPREMAVWDPEKSTCQQDMEKIKSAKIVLWRGYCPVHMKFNVRDVKHVREYFPGAKIIVHPECSQEIVELADAVGSTGFIKKYVEEQSRPGDVLFIGTEWNMVKNLQKEYPDRQISAITRSLCLTMYQISLARLCFAIENIESLKPVELSKETIHYSRVALERMLRLI